MLYYIFRGKVTGQVRSQLRLFGSRCKVCYHLSAGDVSMFFIGYQTSHTNLGFEALGKAELRPLRS